MNSHQRRKVRRQEELLAIPLLDPKLNEKRLKKLARLEELAAIKIARENRKLAKK